MILSSETYVQKAEGVIAGLAANKNQRGEPMMLTASKIRNILAMTSDIYNELMVSKEERLSERVRERIDYLKIRIIYEAGRDTERNKPVKTFVEKAQLRECLDEIRGSRKNYMLFARYMEALVAYHKYYDGKD